MNILKMWKLFKAMKKIKKILKEVKMSGKFGSRKLWFTVGTAMIIVLNRALGLDLDDATITKLIGLVIGYDLAQGAVDLVNKK